MSRGGPEMSLMLHPDVSGEANETPKAVEESVDPNALNQIAKLGEQAETIGGRPALALKPSPGGQGAGSPLPRPSPPAKGREGVGNGAAAAGGLGYGVAASSAAGRERPIAHPLLLVG